MELDAKCSPKRKAANASTPGSKNTRQTVLSQIHGQVSFATPSESASKSPNISNSTHISKLSKLVNELKSQIDMNTQQLNKNTSIVTELKKTVENVDSNVSKMNETNAIKPNNDNNVFSGGRIPSKETFASILNQNNGNQSKFNKQQHRTTPVSSFRPQLNTNRSDSRFARTSRVAESIVPIKVSTKNRILKSCTGSLSEHGLGKAVEMTKRPPKPQMKSIYVSRMSTDITSTNVFDYIKRHIPEIDNENVKVNMLVKKGQDLATLTFVSFRVACTEQIYGKVNDPTFWPKHVMIGDFVEQPRKPKVSDFIEFPGLNARKPNGNDTDIDNEFDINNGTPISMFPNSESHPLSRPVHDDAKENEQKNDMEAVSPEKQLNASVEFIANISEPDPKND